MQASLNCTFFDCPVYFFISGFDVIMDLSKRAQFCQTQGIPFYPPIKLEIPEGKVPWLTHELSYQIYMDVSAEFSVQNNMIQNQGSSI